VPHTAQIPTYSRECGPANADTFRTIWRGFASSVALVATEHNGQRYAMLATSVTSVSMDPPSLLICINSSASSFSALEKRGAFSLGILPAAEFEIGSHFAKSKSAHRFDRGEWNTYPTKRDGGVEGLPWLEQCQATLFCEIDTSYDYGTHRIIVAKVVGAVGGFCRDPLSYCDGKFVQIKELIL